MKLNFLLRGTNPRYVYNKTRQFAWIWSETTKYMYDDESTWMVFQSERALLRWPWIDHILRKL